MGVMVRVLALLGIPICLATLSMFHLLSRDFGEAAQSKCFPSPRVKLTGIRHVDNVLCIYSYFYGETVKHAVHTPVLLLLLPLGFAFLVLSSLESLRPRSFGLVVLYPLWNILTNFVGVGVAAPAWLFSLVWLSRSNTNSPHRSPLWVYLTFISHLPVLVPYIGMFLFTNNVEREFSTAAYMIGSVVVCLFVFLIRLLFSFFRSTSFYGAKAAAGIWLLISGAGLMCHLLFLVSIVNNNFSLFHALVRLPSHHSGGLELIYILLVDFVALQAAFFLFIMIDEGFGAAFVCLLIGCCLGPTTSVSLYLAARELSIFEVFLAEQTAQQDKKRK